MTDYIYANGQLYPSDELQHYGVLGMKWGVRRARVKAAKAAYKKAKSDGRTDAKETYKKAKSDRSKDAAIANKLYSKQSKEANKAVTHMTTGQAIAQSMMFGSYGALKYNEVRSAGASSGRAAVQAVLSNTANAYTGGLLSAAKYLDNRAAR